jgi:hypothetical protein
VGDREPLPPLAEAEADTKGDAVPEVDTEDEGVPPSGVAVGEGEAAGERDALADEEVEPLAVVGGKAVWEGEPLCEGRGDPLGEGVGAPLLLLL